MKDGILEAHDLPQTLRAGFHDRPVDPDVPEDLLRAATIMGATRLPEGARDPIRGRDISANNGTGRVGSFIEQAIEFLMFRITGGLGFVKGVWRDSQFLTWEQQLPQHDDIVKAYYGFPVNPHMVDMDDQLDVFVNTPQRGWKNRIPMIDYELYGPKESATCTPQGLQAYIRGIWKLLGVRDVILYTGFNFWAAKPFTGLLHEMFPKHHKRIHLMNAWYFSMNEVSRPMRYYLANLAKSEWWHAIGGKVPKLCQPFIGAGNIDEDMCRVPKREMRAWAEAA